MGGSSSPRWQDSSGLTRRVCGWKRIPNRVLKRCFLDMQMSIMFGGLLDKFKRSALL